MSDAPAMSVEDEAAIETLERWYDDPVAFVCENFHDPSDPEKPVEPDEWQLDALRAAPINPRLAMKACKGPGKSCGLAWIAWWFLSTRQDSQIVCLSITKDNLKDNLWKELSFWYEQSEFLKASFICEAERIKSRDRPRTWWVSARAFSQQADKEAQANVLAGFHARHVMVILDEVGDYPLGVLAAADGIFANDVDNHLIVAGNPTNVHGALYHICTTEAAKWHLITITGDPDDPKRSPRISLEWARALCEDPGRDNPWVMVNVLGEFPPEGADQLIGLAFVLKAQKRDTKPRNIAGDPEIWGLDPSRFGDDEAALMRRKGIVAFRARVWRNLDGPDLATRVAEILVEREENGEPLPDTIFVDVGGQGASAYDHLVKLGWGHLCVAVDFGSRASKPDRYADKRSEMWSEMARWVKKLPSCLPSDPVLRSELTAPKFEYRIRNKRTVFQLETKDQMRSRGVASPNRGDGLCLTFAGPVSRKSKREEMRRRMEAAERSRARTAYDHFEQQSRGRRVKTSYDPMDY
jgi:hypothetical protein